MEMAGSESHFCGWGKSSGIASLFAKIEDLQFDRKIAPVQEHSDHHDQFSELPEFSRLLNKTGNADPQPQRCTEQHPIPLASNELPENRDKSFRGSSEETEAKAIDQLELTCTGGGDRQLSTEQIMRIAAARFVQSFSPTSDDTPSGNYPFGISFSESELPHEVLKDVELAETLLLLAQEVGNEQYGAATRLLDQCDSLCSNTGHPFQRVVFYFAEALRERIERRTGKAASKGLAKKLARDIDEAMMNSPTSLAFHEKIPFSQILQFAGIQAIIENMANAKKIHVIDLGIKTGVQWTILMQALASREGCPLELLKITAIGTSSMHLIEETGKRLMSFAASLNIPFAFRVIMVTDMSNLSECFFDKAFDDKVAVYSSFSLRSLLPFPDKLDRTMKIIRKMNPRIMVVAEAEAKHNSKSFVSRFTEALFFFSAYFDCLEAFMAREDPHRRIAESMYFGAGIMNIVAAEGEERSIRNVNIDVWRRFLGRFGMVEMELSSSSLHQVDILVQKFDCETSLTVDWNGSCLLLGWKGTPLCSLSVWEFLC